MERFIKGDVLVAQFPFSDLSSKKRRPVLVVAQSDFNDIIVCQITSIKNSIVKSIKLTPTSFASGKLPIISYIRPDKLFCSDRGLVLGRVGRLNISTMQKVDAALMEIFDL